MYTYNFLASAYKTSLIVELLKISRREGWQSIPIELTLPRFRQKRRSLGGGDEVDEGSQVWALTFDLGSEFFFLAGGIFRGGLGRRKLTSTNNVVFVVCRG